MALDPATLAIIIKSIASRFIDKKDLKSSTNITTGAGVSLGGVALILIQSGDPNLEIVGYVLGGLGAILTAYKAKDKK